MSLSGNLEAFPLEEVLRLLARSQQTGCLRIDGAADGRIYLDAGSISFATSGVEDSLRAQLVGSGLMTDAALRESERAGAALGDLLVDNANPADLTEIIREQCVESLYRIRKPAAGPFAFLGDTLPRFRTGQRFEIESLIADSDRRALEWQDIEQTVDDLDSPWHMAPSIEDGSIQLDAGSWQLLAALGSHSSVHQVAETLGFTRFQAAQKMAELSRSNLIAAPAAPVAAAPVVADPVYDATPTPVEEVAAPTQFEAEVETFESAQMPVPVEGPASAETSPEPEQYESDVPAAAVSAVATETVEDTPIWFSAEPDAPVESAEAAETAESNTPTTIQERSWWESSEDETVDAPGALAAVAPAAEEAPATQADDDSNDSDSDSDGGFLDSVFGSLETEETEEETTDEDQNGFGLLRRRGLGSAFRQLADG